MTIAGLATELGFTRLVEALVEAGLDGDFTNPNDGPFTVFAPTNDAFDALYTTLGVSGPADIPTNILQAVLNYHVLDDASVAHVFSTDLVDGLDAPTLQGNTFKVNISAEGVVTLTDNNSTVAEDDATVIATDVLGTNGVVHAIDAVILPINL
jgi:transforming growth factor-beta-induced protein